VRGKGVIHGIGEKRGEKDSPQRAHHLAPRSTVVLCYIPERGRGAKRRMGRGKKGDGEREREKGGRHESQD
jgi:hypothetical protein